MCAERDKLFTEYGDARRILHQLSNRLRGTAQGANGELFNAVYEEVNQARRTLNAARDAFMKHVEQHGCDAEGPGN
jgi:hypothetical protein